MASKKNDKGEPVGWVTVKGKHFPKWADGTIGWQDGEESSPGKTTTKDAKKVSEFGKDAEDKITSYTDKFLKKRSDDEIKELKSNLDKQTKIVGTTEQDQIAYAAIERELESRKTKSADVKATEAILSKEAAQGVGRLKEKYSKKNTSRTTSKNAKYDTSRAFKSTLSIKQQRAAEMAKSSLLFDKGYAEISSNNFSYAKISNADMANYLSAIDPKYDYEYRQEKTKGLFMMPNAEVTHHRIYRKPKKK